MRLKHRPRLPLRRRPRPFPIDLGVLSALLLAIAMAVMLGIFFAKSILSGPEIKIRSEQARSEMIVTCDDGPGLCN